MATLDGTVTTDKISLISQADRDAEAVFHTITTERGRNLTLSGTHHLPVGSKCCSILRKADDVRVGDLLWAVPAGAASASAERVVSKRSTVAVGLHSPVPQGGPHFPIVDGLVSSFDSIRAVKLHAALYTRLDPLIQATGLSDRVRRTFFRAGAKYVDGFQV